MTNPTHPAAPTKKKRTGLIITLALVALGVLACGIGLSVLGSAAKEIDGTPTFGQTQNSAAAAKPAAGQPTTAAAGQKLTASQVQLTVKTLKKDCYGSAGCSVEYTIKAAVVEGAKIPDLCYVTYQVTGLTDTATATLELKPDGNYNQDMYQGGMTPRESSKLKAKITDMECE